MGIFPWEAVKADLRFKFLVLRFYVFTFESGAIASAQKAAQRPPFSRCDMNVLFGNELSYGGFQHLSDAFIETGQLFHQDALFIDD